MIRPDRHGGKVAADPATIRATVRLAVDRGVDLAVSAFSFLATFLMAIMALVRYRVDGTLTRLLQAGAAALVAPVALATNS